MRRFDTHQSAAGRSRARRSGEAKRLRMLARVLAHELLVLRTMDKLESVDELIEVRGGFQTTTGELQTACDAGRANPPAGLTPDQGCLVGVANFASAKTSDEWNKALDNVISKHQ